MVSRKPILTFDTSAINRLSNETDFNALAAGITTAYSTRLTASNISELVATTASEKRDQLLNTCQRLLASGEGVDPFNWIIEKHTKAFDQNPTQYNWTNVNIRYPELEREIIRRTFIDDELARQERESARKTQGSFEDVFGSMRPGFDGVFSRGTERPARFADFVRILQEPRGAFWTGYGAKFYAKTVQNEPGEAKVRSFAAHCPPFLMMILAAVMAQYKRAIVETPKRTGRAGRVDLLMAVYLPYCRVFVTNDGNQEECLRDMAAVANLEVDLFSYGDFRSRLLAPSIGR